MSADLTSDGIERFYDRSYFTSQHADQLGRPLSGYGETTRSNSNADCAAYLIWKYFDVRRALDVGCAVGYVVEALRELRIDASGVDLSRYAISHPAPGAAGHISYGNLLKGLGAPDGSYDVITALEVLEHLPPDSVPAAIAELRRLCNGYLVCTIPSFGPNQHGPDGWLDGKVREEALDHYRSLGPTYDGPIPYDDLYRDANGEAIEGHLTIASFAWWTEQFQRVGFVRDSQLEAQMAVDLDRFGLTGWWNLYVLRAPTAQPVNLRVLRTSAEIAALERRWSFDRW